MLVHKDKTKRHTRQQRRKKSNRKRRKRKEQEAKELKRKLLYNEAFNETLKRYKAALKGEIEALKKKRQVLYEHYGIMPLDIMKVYTNLSYTSPFPDSLRYDPLVSVFDSIEECMM